MGDRLESSMDSVGGLRAPAAGGAFRYERVSIAALGYALAPHVVSSAEIESALAPVYARLGLPEGRLELMTGIRERRHFGEGELPSRIATQAGAAVLERCPELRGCIGALVHASVCRDFLEPATANVVHAALGLGRHVAVLDVSNACLGVLNGMLVVGNMIELGQIDAGLVVAGENGKPLLDATIASLLGDETLTRRSMKGAFASLTIGSGGAAVVLARSDLVPRRPRFLGGTLRAETQHHHLCRGGVGFGERGSGREGLAMETDSEALLHAGLALAESNWARFVEETGYGAPDRIVSHQVGRAHERLLFERLGLDASRGFSSFERLGNVGSAALPMALAMAEESGFVEGGHRVALLGIGSGLSSIMCAVRW